MNACRTTAIRWASRGGTLLLRGLLVVLAGVVLVFAAGGCAGSQPAEESEEAERPPVPPEVSDSTLQPGAPDGPISIPRVAVDIQVESESSLQTEAARLRIGRDGRRCYRLASNRNRTLQGRAVYELFITSNGRVVGVEKLSSNAPSERFERCLESALRRLRFEVPASRAALFSRMYVRLQLWREVYDPDQSPFGG